MVYIYCTPCGHVSRHNPYDHGAGSGASEFLCLVEPQLVLVSSIRRLNVWSILMSHSASGVSRQEGDDLPNRSPAGPVRTTEMYI
jgi:hypothetical protein